MISFLKQLLRPFIEQIHRLVPKRNHAVIYGWPDFEDNTICLEQGLQDTDLDQVFLLMTGPQRQPIWQLGGKSRMIRKNSPIGLWRFLTARYVFFTHPCFARHFPSDVVSVNVWHGMPIKRIGKMLQNHEVIRSSHNLATSPFWSDIMTRSMPAEKPIPNCGLPRNDRLFSDRADVMRKIGVSDARKLIVCLPTYRKSVRGELRQDGQEYGNPFELPGIDMMELNDFLKKHHAVLLTKPHPMAMHAGPREWSHLKIIHESWLHGHALSLYETIGASDLLISDISSVVIDYLLLDRPIIHAFPDIDEYQNSRGFTVEPIEDYFAGAVVSNQQELLTALEHELSGQDPHQEKRRKLRDLSHTHQDDKSTERLLQEIGLKV